MTRVAAVCILGLGLNAVESRIRTQKRDIPLEYQVTVDFGGFATRAKIDTTCDWTTIQNLNNGYAKTVTDLKDTVSKADGSTPVDSLAAKAQEVVIKTPLFPSTPTYSWVDPTGELLLRHHMAITLGAQSVGSVTSQASFIFWSQVTDKGPDGAYTYVRKQSKSRRNKAGSGDLGLKLNRGNRKITDAADKEMWITTSRGTYELFILKGITDGYEGGDEGTDVTFHVASGENFDESWLVGVDDGEHNWVMVSTNKPEKPAMVNTKGEIAFVNYFHYTSAGLKQDFVPEPAVDFKKDAFVDSFYPCVASFKGY